MGRRPVVLLIRPGRVGWDDVDVGLPHALAVAGALPAPVVMLDLAQEVPDRAALARRLDELSPLRLVYVPVSSAFELWRAIALGRFLRARHPGLPLVAGGAAAAALTGDLRAVYDHVVPGESAQAVLEIVQRPGPPGVARPPAVEPAGPLPWERLRGLLARAPRYGSRLALPADLRDLERLAGALDLSGVTLVLSGLPAEPEPRRALLERLAAAVRPLAVEVVVEPSHLDDADVQWLVRARAEARILLGRDAEAELRFVGLAQHHRLPWTAELVVGQVGETLHDAIAARQLVEELFAGPSSHGWLSVRPFRLLPGSPAHARREHLEATWGVRLYHPTWWRQRHDQDFRSQHVDPSAVFDHEARVRWMHDEYGPLLAAIHERYSSVDGHDHPRSRLIRRRQRAGLCRLSRAERDRLLALGRAARASAPGFPLGVDARAPAVRGLESALRLRADRGLPVDERLVAALFAAPPSRLLSAADARAMLGDRVPVPAAEGWAPTTVGLGALITGLHALSPRPGERALDLAARSPLVAALLAQLVGPLGEVVAVAPDAASADALRAALVEHPRVEVVIRGPAHRFDVPGRFDVVWLGAALPRVPHALRSLLTADGRALTAVGPRDGPQELVLVEPQREHAVGRDRWPVLGGAEGWLPWPRDPHLPPIVVRRAEGPARFFATLTAAREEPRPDEAWARIVAETWPGCPGVGVLPRLGLVHLDVDELLRALRWPPPGLSDRAGRALCSALATGIEVGLTDPITRFGRLSERVVAQLEAVRAQLWAPQGLRPPALVLLDVPALGRRSRAASVDGAWHVATSHAMPEDHVLMQVLSEEMHLVTDPQVRAEGATSGPALQRRLQQTALEATAAFLDARAPHHRPAFERWRRGQVDAAGGETAR